LVLHLVSPALISDWLGYSDEIRNNSIKIARASGGDLHLISNSSDGMIPYGQMYNWQTASVNLTKRLWKFHKITMKTCFLFWSPRIHHTIEIYRKVLVSKMFVNNCVWKWCFYTWT
jgi:hypothetical protein